MQTDTTLVNGILERLDLVANKLNVSAQQLWEIWRSAHMLPLMEVGVGVGVIGVALVILWRVYARIRVIEAARAKSGDRWEHDPDGFWIFLALVGIGTFIGAALVAGSIPSALMAANNPDWYALQQLSKVLGQ